MTPPRPKTSGISAHGTDWDYLENLSDEDIAKAVSRDPDAAPILSEEEMRRRYKPHPTRFTR